MKISTLISFLALMTPFCAFGDGMEPKHENAQQIFPGVPEAPEAGSDAQFDKRLPPVLAGEIVNDSGKRKRVWSTSGPVPVSNAPEPWKDENAVNKAADPGSVSVILDRRAEPRLKEQSSAPESE